MKNEILDLGMGQAQHPKKIYIPMKAKKPMAKKVAAKKVVAKKPVSKKK